MNGRGPSAWPVTNSLPGKLAGSQIVSQGTQPCCGTRIKCQQPQFLIMLKLVLFFERERERKHTKGDLLFSGLYPKSPKQLKLGKFESRFVEFFSPPMRVTAQASEFLQLPPRVCISR